MTARPPALRLYGAFTALASPFAPLVLKRRAKAGKEDPARLGERMGRASVPRPEGPLVWLHGASVGESLSHLPLVERLRRERPDIHILVTSGTRTSAKLLEQRLPAGAVHQYAPLDTPGAVRRFIRHWRPGLGIFVESELWPNLLHEAKAAGVNLALLGARISQDSAKGWDRAPRSARALLSLFDLVLAQDERTLRWLEGHGGLVTGELDLKHAAQPLPYDAAALADLKQRLGERAVVVAASTHPGEDELITEAFVRAVKKARPAKATSKPLLILIPRHPERGPAIAESLSGRRLVVFRREAGDQPADAADIYIADTLGELGLFFRAARLVLMGGGFLPDIGGHNPLEPARLSVPVVSGTQIANFQRTYDEMFAAKAAYPADDIDTLAQRMADLLAHPDRAREMGLRAKAYCDRGEQALKSAWAALKPLLPPPGPPA
jgi:3-deoxy-D-manno-octulosonic-acid transferase